MVKNPPADAGDPGSIPKLGRSPGGGNSNPFQYSCLENPMDRGAWWATVPRVAESDIDWATEHTHTYIYIYICLFSVSIPLLGCQLHESKALSICIHSAQSSAFLNGWVNPYPPHCSAHVGNRPSSCPSGLLSQTSAFRDPPVKPSLPSTLLSSLNPEKLYLARGRAVWLWLITYSSKSIIYASTVCPESFRPEASQAQKPGFETQKAFFLPP